MPHLELWFLQTRHWQCPGYHCQLNSLNPGGKKRAQLCLGSEIKFKLDFKFKHEFWVNSRAGRVWIERNYAAAAFKKLLSNCSCPSSLTHWRLAQFWIYMCVLSCLEMSFCFCLNASWNVPTLRPLLPFYSCLYARMEMGWGGGTVSRAGYSRRTC